LRRIRHKIEADPNARLYRDGALMPVAEEAAEHMALYTQNEAARVAVARELRVAGKSGNGHAAKGFGRGSRAEPDTGKHDSSQRSTSENLMFDPSS
jgi:hypothetical protein